MSICPMMTGYTDRQAIAAVQAKGKDLSTVFGDSGGEYRTRG